MVAVVEPDVVVVASVVDEAEVDEVVSPEVVLVAVVAVVVDSDEADIDLAVVFEVEAEVADVFVVVASSVVVEEPKVGKSVKVDAALARGTPAMAKSTSAAAMDAFLEEIFMVV